MKKAGNYIIFVLGIILLLSGLYLLYTVDNPQTFMIALPYVFIGVGCGLSGQGLGSMISHKIMQKNPAMQKQMEINSRDERNTAISNRAKARAYDLMIFIFGALMLIFVLLGVGTVPLLLFVFTYLFLQGYALYCRRKLEKEM